jgi:internalin A
MRFKLHVLVVVASSFFHAGCGGQPAPAPQLPTPATTVVPTAPAIDDPAAKRWEQLQEQLIAANAEYKSDPAQFREENGRITMVQLDDTGVQEIAALKGLPLTFLSLKNCPVSNLSAIQGMPLNELALEETEVTDLGPLAGSPLTTLWLNNAPVADLKPLAGLPLTSLNVLGTQVVDLEPLRGAPLAMLWLNETHVADLSPLAECPLQSLTVHKTPVRDLSVVRQLPSLQRLHIGETEITDLRPLKGLLLTRLIFTPSKITQGIDVVRQMSSLQELDVELREPQRWSPDEFWRRYDAGELK